MTHLERFCAAMWVSEVWYTSWMLKPKRIYYRARAVVVADRALNIEY